MLQEIIKLSPIFKPTDANKSTLTNTHYCICTRNELYKSARHFTYQTQNTKLMHNLPTRTILNVGISCFTNFPVVTERKIMRCLPKESQSKRTKSHRYHNCQRLPSCFRRITRKSRLRATGTDILCHVT